MGAMRSAAKEAGKPSLLSKILAASWAGLHVGGPGGAVTGAAGAIGEHLTRAMRGAGLAKARDIVQAGILDPEIGRQLLRRASELPDSAGAGCALAKAIARRSVFTAPGVSASAGSSSWQEIPASVGYGLKRLNSALSAADAQSCSEIARSRSPLGEQIRSSLDKFVRAATVLQGLAEPCKNSARFMLAARNLSTNLSDAGIGVSPENIAPGRPLGRRRERRTSGPRSGRPSTVRDARTGKFQAGVSGNKSGRPKGAPLSCVDQKHAFARPDH